MIPDNTSDEILANANNIARLIVVQTSEYQHLKAQNFVREFNSSQMLNALEFCIETANEDHEFVEFLYKDSADSTHSNYLSHTTMFECFAVLLMREIIPAFANSLYYSKPYGNTKSVIEGEIKEKRMREYERELRDAFTRGLHAYNLSQIKTDEDKATGKTTDIQ